MAHRATQGEIMNYPARIVAAVLNNRLTDVEAIRDHVGLSERNFDLMVGKLCGQGTLKLDNNGDSLTVADEAQAKRVIDGAIIPEPMKRGPGRPPSNVPPPAVHLEPAKITVRPRGERPDTPAEIRADAKKKRRKRVVLDDHVDIERHVPLPVKVKPGPRVWPFDRMNVGDSFSVPVPEGFDAKAVIAALRRDVAAYMVTHPLFRTFIQAEEPVDRDARELKVRLWVIEPKPAAGWVEPFTEPLKTATPSLGLRTLRHGATK